jgi:SepF-like predicted cell division protein (DUF552 family)
MKNKLLIWIIACLLLAAAVLAAPPNPEFYWGYVFIESDFAPDNTVLTCRTGAGELLANVTVPYAGTGSYFAQINFDRPETPIDEGADLNESIIWYVDGIEAIIPENDYAESGRNNNNFDIVGIRNPNVTTIVHYLPQYSISDTLNLSVVLNNTGDGSANAQLNFNTAKNIFIAKNSSNSTSFEETLETCGAFERELYVVVRNYGNQVVANDSHNISYSVIGPDLQVELHVSEAQPKVGDNVNLTAIVTNIGGLNISGYNMSLFAGNTRLISLEYNNVLEPNSSRNITYFWAAQAAVFQLRVVAETSTGQCSAENDQAVENVSVVTVGSSRGGSSASSQEERTKSETFELNRFPATIDLISGDRIGFESEGKLYTIIIEDVSDSKAAATMAWEPKYYAFEEGEEQVLYIGNYELFMMLEKLDGNKATYSFDLIKKVGIGAMLNIEDNFAQGSNVSYSIDINSEIEVEVQQSLFKLNKEVWNSSVITAAGIFEQNLGQLEEGDYFLYVELHAGKQVKEIEKEFSVRSVQQMPTGAFVVSGAISMRNWLVWILLGLISAAFIIYIKHHSSMKAEEPQKSAEPAVEMKDVPEELAEEAIEKKMPEEKKQALIQKIKTFILSILPKKSKIPQEEIQAVKTEKVDFAGGKGNVYLPYNNLFELRDWLNEYHIGKKITLKMSRMPEIVQKIGPQIYENPKEIERNDFLRVNSMFKEKHDYISYNDLMLGGSIVARELKKTLGVTEPEAKKTTNKQGIRFFVLNDLDVAKKVLESLRLGSIVIIDIKPFQRQKENLKRVIDIIKNTADVLKGDIGLSGELLIVTPNESIKIFRQGKGF